MASTSPSWTAEPVILNQTFSVKDYSFSQPALKRPNPTERTPIKDKWTMLCRVRQWLYSSCSRPDKWCEGCVDPLNRSAKTKTKMSMDPEIGLQNTKVTIETIESQFFKFNIVRRGTWNREPGIFPKYFWENIYYLVDDPPIKVGWERTRL